MLLRIFKDVVVLDDILDLGQNLAWKVRIEFVQLIVVGENLVIRVSVIVMLLSNSILTALTSCRDSLFASVCAARKSSSVKLRALEVGQFCCLAANMLHVQFGMFSRDQV